MEDEDDVPMFGNINERRMNEVRKGMRLGRMCWGLCEWLILFMHLRDGIVLMLSHRNAATAKSTPSSVNSAGKVRETAIS